MDKKSKRNKVLAIEHYLNRHWMLCNHEPYDDINRGIVGMFAYLDNQLTHHRDTLSGPTEQDFVGVWNWCRQHAQGKKPAHVFAADFFKDLVKSKVEVPLIHLVDKDVYTSSSELQKDSWGYSLEFPQTFRGTDGMYHNSAIVYTTWQASYNEAGIVIVSPDLTEDGQFTYESSIASVHIENIGINEALTKWGIQKDSRKDAGLTEEFLSVCLRAVLYIRSKQPDIQQTKVEYPKTKKPKKIRLWERENYILDHQKVGYSFHGRERHVTEGGVRGHYKFIGTGPGRRNLEYRWWSPHTRNYQD